MKYSKLFYPNLDFRPLMTAMIKTRQLIWLQINKEPKDIKMLIPARDLVMAVEIYWLIHYKYQKQKAEDVR